MLSAGVTCVQMNKAGGNGSAVHEGQNFMVGLAAILTSAITSGFAGIYFERALKNGSHTMWMRNLESAFFSIIFGYMAAYGKDAAAISAGGFFQNYDRFTVATIFLQAVGGMIIVAVVAYTDNIIKCFANACSIITSAIASYLILQDFVPTWLFVFGASLVIISVFFYSSQEEFITLPCIGQSGKDLDLKYAQLVKEKAAEQYWNKDNQDTTRKAASYKNSAFIA